MGTSAEFLLGISSQGLLLFGLYGHRVGQNFVPHSEARDKLDLCEFLLHYHILSQDLYKIVLFSLL